MSKLLKPLIIVLFLLSIGALVLGTMLYQKREIVKGRTQKLENAVTAVARNLKYPGLNAEMLKDLSAMDGQLNPVTTKAQETQRNLEATTESLAQTQQTLQETEATLAATQGDLQQATDRIAALEEDVTARQGEIDRQKTQIAGLEGERDDLNNQVSQLRNDIELAQASLTDLEREYDSLNKAFEDCVRKEVMISGTADVAGPTMDPNFAARVLLVNPEWNFVIIDKGSMDELRENAVLLVHRDSEPIGKVRVSRMAESISVAEIMSTWEGAKPDAGDEVISPKSS